MEWRVVVLRPKTMKRYSTLKTKTPLRAKKPWNPVRKPLAQRSGLKTGNSLKTRVRLKAKRNIRKVGKVGKANLTARALIADYAKKMNLTKCEIGLEGCTGSWPVAPAHRHKRAWYKGDAVLLAHPKQWIVACQCCHDQIEFDAELTEEVFTRLRGAE